MSEIYWKEADRHLLDRAMTELEDKVAAVDLIIHLGESIWRVDQDEGKIFFDRPDGLTAVAPVQIIGTYNTVDSTWLWAWGNPSILDPLTQNARFLQSYGASHEMEALTTRKLECIESNGWEFTALACKLCDMQAAYRGPAGTSIVFMTFGNLRLVKGLDNS